MPPTNIRGRTLTETDPLVPTSRHVMRHAEKKYNQDTACAVDAAFLKIRVSL